MKSKGFLVNTVLVLLSVIVGLIALELIFRAMIFGESPLFEKFRNPGYYADSESEDLYWKLYHRWNGELKPPDCPHPLLGWTGYFTRYSLLHRDSGYIGDRRPVLLYGDSFAGCVPPAKCFDELLNNDMAFAKDNYLINYGVGGYGVDQIALLCKKTYPYYDKPFVIFSLGTIGLDRSILTFRTGQKPYYSIENASLKLSGVPVNPKPAQFLEQNPPRVFSYVLRKLIYSKQKFLPDKLSSFLRRDTAYTEQKKKINELILLDVVKNLRDNKVDFVFLVFHPLWWDRDNFGTEIEKGWREAFLKQFLVKNKIPYIWSRDLLRQDTTYDHSDISKYIFPSNWHPTTHYNTLVSNEIKKIVLKRPDDFSARRKRYSERMGKIISNTEDIIGLEPNDKDFFDYKLEYYSDYIGWHIRAIKRRSDIMRAAEKQAREKGKSIEEMLAQFAFHFIYAKEKECKPEKWSLKE